MSWRKILLSVKLLSHSRDLKNIAQALGDEVVFICPNPTLADDTRLVLGEAHEVLTISKFMSNLLERAECPQKVVRKSELMLELATIWKKYDPELSLELFGQAFNLFTELRSFSLQKELFDDVYSQLDSRLSYSIQIFWAYCEALDIVDEHRAYTWISNWLQTPDESQEKEFPSVVFYGFSHLNGNQVDFIKNLSLRTQVALPFPASAYAESSNRDYIKWFDQNEDLSMPQADADTPSKLNVFRFPEGRMNEAFALYEKEHGQLTEHDIVLLTKNLEKRFVLEIPAQEHFYKAKASVFEQDWHAVSEIMTQEFADPQISWPTQQLLDFLESHLKKELKVGFEHKNFRLIKLWTEMTALTERYADISELNENVQLYDIKILLEVLRLNLPRVYTLPLLTTDQAQGASLKGLEGLYRGENQRPLLICAQSEYPPLKSGRSSFGQDTLKILSGIGPIKRAELELMMMKFRLNECLEQEDTVLFLESGLEESDPAWDEILQKYEVKFKDLIPEQKSQKSDFFQGRPQKIELKNLSATRLQSYIECPRKFYYQHIESVSTRENLESELRADQLGTLEHALIEKYATQEAAWDELKHSTYVSEMLNQFLKKEKKSISTSRYEEYFNELKVYSQNGLVFYYSLKEWMPEASFSFERKVSIQKDGVEKRGSIDLLIQSSLGCGIVDFKRSAGSIPSQKAILEFEKIQLWFYLHALEVQNQDFLFSGFFNLSEPEESLFMGCDSEFKKELQGLGVKAFTSKDFAGDYESYQNFEVEKLEELRADEAFLARPYKPDACRFCDLSNVCPRGEV